MLQLRQRRIYETKGSGGVKQLGVLHWGLAFECLVRSLLIVELDRVVELSIGLVGGGGNVVEVAPTDLDENAH